MKDTTLTSDQVMFYSQQFKGMSTEVLTMVMESCYSRIGQHYTFSDKPDERYMIEQRDIARLAAYYTTGHIHN